VEEDDDGMSTATMTDAITLEEATAFIWNEADMLDRLDYRPWLKLWAQGGLYIIPTERDVKDLRRRAQHRL
jgi:3-phenylpropionate/cinnamic acid dioxygenase small subunit